MNSNASLKLRRVSSCERLGLKAEASSVPGAGSSLRFVCSQLGDDFCCGYAGLVGTIGREADGSHAGMAAAAVALAHLGQIHHLGRVGLGPGVGADGYLGAETGLRQANGVGGVGVQIVGDELVEAFQ